jgi:hypothetical protein
MRKKKRRISDFTNFAPEFVEDFTNETPKDINLRNYLDDEDQREMRLKELDKEQKEREEVEKTIEESIDNNDDVAQAAQYVKELLWEFGDDIRKEIQVDKYNNLSVLIRPKYERISTLEDAKTGLAIRIGEEFVDRLMSIAVMLQDLKLTNIFEITWLNITDKGNRTRRRSEINGYLLSSKRDRYIKDMVKLLKDKPIYQVRITAGKPIK